MTRITKYGGGFFHHTTDASTLPQIVAQQVPQRAPEAKRQDRDYMPALAKGSQILAGLPERSFPPVKGYVEAELKPGARLDLMLPHDGTSSPLLASWRYGKGKAAVFTSDQAGRWSKDWIAWPGLERFWGKVFAWLPPERELLPAHEARINRLDGPPVLDFYLYGEESDGNVFRYTFQGIGGRGEGLLKRVAPGHYQSELPFTGPGDYRIELKEERRGRTVSYPIVGYTLPVEAKVDVFKNGFNLPLLDQIAQFTGGTINPGPSQEQKREYTPPKMTFLRSYFILLAALIFILEIFFRRFFLVEF
jgi:hypothetical protein